MRMFKVMLCQIASGHAEEEFSSRQNMREDSLRCIRQIMQPGKTYRRACFAWAKDADSKICLGKRYQRQPSANHYNHICV